MQSTKLDRIFASFCANAERFKSKVQPHNNLFSYHEIRVGQIHGCPHAPKSVWAVPHGLGTYDQETNYK